jgi:hypothetical protein
MIISETISRIEELPPAGQVRWFAGVDILLAMHGSALSLAGFLPARSLVVEVLPPSFDYCAFHRCLSHETIWVQAVPPSGGGGGAGWRRSRTLSPAPLLRVLDEAMVARNSSLMACPAGSAAARSEEGDEEGAPQTLREWMLGRPAGSAGVYCASHPRLLREGASWECGAAPVRAPVRWSRAGQRAHGAIRVAA